MNTEFMQGLVIMLLGIATMLNRFDISKLERKIKKLENEQEIRNM